jgi:hypothetical protein
MKLLLWILLTSDALYAQESMIEDILKDVRRDSSDKTCKNIYDNYYESFESDEGLKSKKMGVAITSMFQCKLDPNSPNRQLVLLLEGYMNSISTPEKALAWIEAMKKEYKNIYKTEHPLILLYEGESLINGKRAADAKAHFNRFLKAYPKSVMAWVYIYKMETDKRLAQTWLSVLKAEHPNHWVVKELQ